MEDKVEEKGLEAFLFVSEIFLFSTNETSQ